MDRVFKKISSIVLLFFFFHLSLLAETINVFEFTKEEMKVLDYGSNNLKKSMPAGWDGKDNLARFSARNIELV